MVEFYVYDLAFLVLFTLGVVWFLYKRRRNLKREGIMYLYRTKVGIKAIDYIGDKFSGFLHKLKYVVIAMGFVLMGGMIYLLWNVVYTYVKFPQITEVIKAPPIAPVIPYFPKLFGLESFFPPFYFTYFLVALAIVAVVHEFSHGIFMRLFKIKIKSTGFVFLGPILGAFVEEDKGQMEKKSIIGQMSVLGAGTFANVVTGLVFFAIFVLFFTASYAPAGYVFNTYSLSLIPSDSVTGIEDFGNLTMITSNGQTFLLDEDLKFQLDNNASELLVYDDAPAIRNNLEGVIVQVDEFDINNHDDLANALGEKIPGDTIRVSTKIDDEIKEYDIILDEHPLIEGKPFLGVGNIPPQENTIVQKVLVKFMSFKDSTTHYEPNWDGNFVIFVYNFLWWIMVINFLVALFNMLPLGILDGGRFFYLTILSLTKSEKFAKLSFKFVTALILLVFFVLMLFWFIRIF